MRALCCFAMASLAAVACTAAPAFQTAKPVWPEGLERQMNSFVEFRVSFDAKAGERPTLRVTGSSVYRIRLNGEFAGYGPARAAKGFFRVDEWPLAATEGRNDLTIEVSAYNCNNYYVAEWPGFLQAEVVFGDRVLASTGRDFSAYGTQRVTKCSRYSFQRAFNEAYRMSADFNDAQLKLAEQPAVPLIERIAPLPDFTVTKLGSPISATKVRRLEKINYRSIRSVDNPELTFKLYPADALEANIWRELQHVEVLETTARSYHPSEASIAKQCRKTCESAPCHVQDGSGFVFDVGFNESGFPGMTVVCTKPGKLWIAFDEILQDGKVNPLRYGVANGVVWDLQPGRYSLEAFEPYTFRYLHVFAIGGAFEVSDPYMRGYKNPDAKKASFKSSDPALDKIFVAARETFAQNAVDVFTDCPSRERAGWLCDSFFTGRSSVLFTGSTDLERLFIQNYVLPESFPELPDGALPMCYPADHPNHNFIPNWAMWFVIEVDEYLARSGDRSTVDALKPRLVKLVDYLKTFRNSDGLLEKLPAWVFVEWSEANNLVQDVNYPSNMTWAEVLDCMDRLYGMPDLADEARRVRETVRKQSWTGRWFCDNAIRQPDGSLKLSGKCTETCQYYAFMFKTATPERDPELWRTMLDDFGPQRKKTKKHPEIYFSNAFIGNYLRLELLSRAGLGRQLLDETKGYFTYMADRTGTLWENDTPHASCNHGFASHAAVFYVKNVLGIAAIDARAKTGTVQKTDVPLESCSATLPVPGGAVTYGWTKKGDVAEESFSAPPGWRLARPVEITVRPVAGDATVSLQKALDDCFLAGGGTVAVEKGVYAVKGLRLRSRTTLLLRSGAKLKASRDCDDYEILANDKVEPVPESEFAPGVVWVRPKDRKTNDHLLKSASRWNNAIIRILHAHDVSIIGEAGSEIDGCDSYDPIGEEHFRGVHGISVHDSTNLVFRGYTIRDTGNWAHNVWRSADLKFEGLTILGGHDGIHFSTCDRVAISGCEMKTGDDCVAGFDNEDVTVGKCSFNTACSAFRFGGRRVFVENCRAYGPGEYPIRNSLPKADRISGSHGVPGAGRRTLLSLFTYYSDFTIKVRHAPGDIVVRNCSVERAERFLHYNFSGNETWQKNRPLSSICFENVTARDIEMSLCAYGDAKEPLSLSMKNCRIAFAKPQREFVRGAHIGELRLEGVAVESVEGPCVRSWGGVAAPKVFDISGVGAEVEAASESFRTKPI